jgi:hypothetical protein
MLEMGKNITIEFLNKNQDNRVLSKKKPPFKIQTHYFRSLGFEPTISLRVGISDLLQQLIREYPRH